ncbi:hypothetical protein FHR81_004837 [Actinoalloteichus hoggarensis]|nr:hypothetical protein [Actinoalloteichus hoggarensis]
MTTSMFDSGKNGLRGIYAQADWTTVEAGST